MRIKSLTINLFFGYTVSLSINQVPAGFHDFINIMKFIDFQLN